MLLQRRALTTSGRLGACPSIGCCSGSISGSGTTAFRLAPLRALGDKQRAFLGLAWHERCACGNY